MRELLSGFATNRWSPLKARATGPTGLLKWYAGPEMTLTSALVEASSSMTEPLFSPTTNKSEPTRPGRRGSRTCTSSLR